MIPKNKTKEIERQLTISNLVFLTISGLTIKQMEILRVIHNNEYEEELDKIIARRIRMHPSRIHHALKPLTFLRLIDHKCLGQHQEVIKLTNVGKLVAQEIAREV